MRQSQKRPVSQLVAGLIVILLLLLFARSIGDRSAPEETSATRSIRMIHVAQTNYYSQFGRYAESLEELRALLPDYDLASGVRYGYRFRVQGSQTSYEVHAEPLRGGGSSYYSDQTLLLRRSPGPGSATSTSEPLR